MNFRGQRNAIFELFECKYYTGTYRSSLTDFRSLSHLEVREIENKVIPFQVTSFTINHSFLSDISKSFISNTPIFRAFKQTNSFKNDIDECLKNTFFLRYFKELVYKLIPLKMT